MADDLKIDRRSVLGGLALGSELLPLVRPARAAKPDATLLALRDEWRRAEVGLRKAERAVSDAENRYVRLSEPEPLYERQGDFDLFGCHIGRKQQWPGAPQGRLIAHPEILSSFEALIPHFRSFPPRAFTERHERQIARMEEVLATFAEWSDTNQSGWRAAGIETATAACDQASETAMALRVQIASLPATTPEGRAFKIDVLCSCWAGDSIEEELRYLIEAGNGSDEGLLFSLARDLIQMSEAGLLSKYEVSARV